MMPEYIDLTGEDTQSRETQNVNGGPNERQRRERHSTESSEDEVVVVEMRQVSPPQLPESQRQQRPQLSQRQNNSCEDIQVVSARPLTSQQRLERIRQEHRRRANIAQSSGQTEPRPDMPLLAFGMPPQQAPSRTWGAVARDDLDDPDNDPDYEPQPDGDQDIDAVFEQEIDDEVYNGQLTHFFGDLSRIFRNINDIHMFPTSRRLATPQRRSRRQRPPTRSHNRVIFRPPTAAESTRASWNMSPPQQYSGFMGNFGSRQGADELGSLEHRMLEHALMHSLDETSSRKQLSVDQIRKPPDPQPASPGFTRQACDDVVCISCQCTLGEGDKTLQGKDLLLSRRVFARGCQHVYCGRCAFDISKAQGKAKQCPEVECRKLRSRAKNKFRELWV